MSDKETLIEWLEHKVKSEESTAEECIQEMEDEESANSHLSKATAFQEVLDFIHSESNIHVGVYQTDSFVPMEHDYERRLNHSQRGNYPYPVDQSTCGHIFEPVADSGIWKGPMKAKCQKCGYEP